MIRLLLLQAFLLTGLIVLSQKGCEDVIYAVEGNKVIFNCCIQDVRQGNVIIYEKDGDVEGIEAYAVTMNGQYMELHQPGKIAGEDNSRKAYYKGHYNGHSYAYYENLYLSARMRSGFGKVITITGIVMAGYALIFMDSKYDGGQYVIIGSLIASVGIPLWISGGVKADNNHRAMDAIKNSTQLSLGPGQHGIGLVYRF